MNTTFTTYAEKKAKQILNLLQGYTKGIRITAILILLLIGVSNAWGYTATFRCVPALTFGHTWSNNSLCKVKLKPGDDKNHKTYDMYATGLMYESDGKLYEIYAGTASDLPHDGAKDLHFERWEGSSWKENAGQYDDWRDCNSWSGSMHYGSWGNYSYKNWDLANNSYIYFETPSNWGASLYFMIGHDSYSKPYKMSKISNTRLYYIKMPEAFGGYTQTAFIGFTPTGDFGGWGSKIADRSEYSGTSNKTSVYSHNNENSLSTYNLFLSDLALHRASSNADLKHIINQNQTINVQGEDGNLNASAGTVNISYKTFSAYITSVTSSTATTSNGTKTVAAAFTSSITLTANANSGYEFIGWYDGSTRVSTNTTYSYEVPYGEKTIAARFRKSATVIYLRPNDTWLLEGAVFAAYAWKSTDNSKSEWYPLITTAEDFTGAYRAEISAEYDRVIFARFNPETTSFGFNNFLWNQTIDLHMTLDNLEEYGYRFAIIDDNKDGEKFNGAWEQNTAIWGIEGSFNDWKAENAVLKGYEGTTTVELDAQDYEFKLYNFPHRHYYGNTGTMLRGGSENWQMDYNGVNCGIKADMEGDYVFKLKFTTDNSTLKKRVTVVYPEKVFVVKGLLAAYEINQGETYTITPKVILPDGKQENNVELVVIRTSGNDKITATASGLNIKITGTAAGNATFTATYTLDDKPYEFTFTVTVVADDKVTIQVKVPTNFGDEDQYQWKDPEQIKIHYWGNGISDGDITMTYLSTVNEHIILQARVPKGTDNKTNFLVYYAYYDNNNEKWRKTDDVKDVSSNGCYLLWKEGVAEKYHRGITREGAKCTEYFQVEIVMGSGKTFYSNALYNADQSEILSFFAPGESEIGYKKGSVKLLENGIAIANIPASSFAVSGVYTATLNAGKDGLENIALYEGDYYIRTDGASGMWSDYLNPEKNNKMTYFIPREHEKYDHYWAESITPVDNKVNIKACVANQYNEDLANMLTKDRFTNDDGNVECDKIANVRFGYNPSTNHFERAVLKGSEEANFLNIISDQIYKEEQCNTKLSSANSNSQFTDQSNWVYQKDVYVRIENNTSSAEIVISSTAYNGEVNHLLGYEIDPDNGNETTTPKKRTIVGSGTDAGTYMIRTIYDFKTNRMIMAWVPGTQNITGEKTINADVLFIRHEQEEVPQLTLGTTGSVRSLEGVFFALELDRDERKNYLQEEHYWISLPFDCKVGSISGVPGYMTTWGIQRYRGDLRAEKGWFKETPTFWEWMGLDDTMNAGEGYVLSFDKRLASWKDIGDKAIVRLYFPAMSNGFDFTNSNNLSRTYENQPCTIPTAGRDKQDSNWKVIGTLSYNNATASNVDNTNPNQLTAHPSFVYEYQYGQGVDNSTKNPKYNPVNGVGYSYKSFHGYMVQFAGTITWNSLVASAPEQLAARRNTSSMPTNVTMRLELVDGNDVQHDQTFVALDEDGTTTFDQNKDLNKVLNTGYANIYTLSEGIPFAGNTLPMEKAIVPVGVQIAAEGEYTFRMPDGTEGMVVELVDYETNTRTNLLLSDYTVTLPKGTSENRFALHIQPQKDVVTSLENIGEGVNNGEAVNKYLIDGKLIIRTAEGVFDAQGHRL